MRIVMCLALVFAAAGCSKQFMCNLNGTSCPAGSTPSAEEAPAESSAESSSEEAPAEETGQSTEAAGPACKGVGQEVDSIHDCCEGLDTESRGYLHNGGHYFCCERDKCVNTPE